MEALTRLVSESLARYGLDRPVDYRRLQWSRWFRCESPHSLLFVPSKPGVFALAEEIMDLGSGKDPVGPTDRVGPGDSSAPERRLDFRPIRDSAPGPRRMLAVLQFGEDDDMAFVLDRMLSRDNPMRARLLSGRCFVRFVVIEDEAERRSICNALNQWMISSGEKASGIGAHFASSLELSVARVAANAGDPVGQTSSDGNKHCVGADDSPADARTAVYTAPENLKADEEHPAPQPSAPHPDSGAATNIHCPQPLPSGF